MSKDQIELRENSTVENRFEVDNPIRN
jgi:hypothetical protein